MESLAMAELFASGRFVDFILILVVIEALILSLSWAFSGRGLAPIDLLPTLCAGAFLLLALRAVLVGAGWQIASLCLALAGLSHVVDLVRRWRN